MPSLEIVSVGLVGSTLPWMDKVGIARPEHPLWNHEAGKPYLKLWMYLGKHGTRWGESFEQKSYYRKKTAQRKVFEMQKQRSVEVVRCNNKWANGCWDANERAWENPCTADWMNQWTNSNRWMNEPMNRWIRESMKKGGNESMNHQTNEIVRVVSRWTNEPMNEWSNESENQWSNEALKQRSNDNESMTQGLNETVNERISDSADQWISESTNQWTDESMSSMIQTIKEWMNQWINDSTNQWTTTNQWIIESLN